MGIFIYVSTNFYTLIIKALKNSCSILSHKKESISHILDYVTFLGRTLIYLCHKIAKFHCNKIREAY